nr:MAG TPA: hypothetical protein [Caudoviricetes sp.]
MTRYRCYRNDISATHSGVSSHSVRRQPGPTRSDSRSLPCLTLHVKIKPLRGLRPAAPQADRLGDLIRPTISIPSPPLALRSESKSRVEKRRYAGRHSVDVVMDDYGSHRQISV